MSRVIVYSSFSRPAPTRSALRSTPIVQRSSYWTSSLNTNRRSLSPQVFQARAKGKGKSSGSGKKPDEDEPEKEPEIFTTPTPTPPPSSPIEPVAKSYPPTPSSNPPEEKKPSMQGGSPGQSEAQVEEEEAVQPWREDRAADIRSLKASLLGAVAGFDRGFAAVPRDTAKIRNIVESLETLSGSIDLTGEVKTAPSSQELFNGTWKLIFTSAFNAGRRLPALANTPFTFGPVFQVIDTQKRELDNVVELLASNAPQFPWTPSNAVPKLRLTLKHDMSYSMSIVSIQFKETNINVLDSGFDIPKVTLPSLPGLLRSTTGRSGGGEFSLVYLDEDLRITEGDKSELRIFVKTADLD